MFLHLLIFVPIHLPLLTSSLNSDAADIALLKDGAFHAFLLPQENVVFISITDVLSSASHVLFETLNKTSECGAFRLVIYLSSSAVTMKEI